MSKEDLQNNTPNEQYEEFDYLSDFYFPIKEVEEKHSSPILARLRDKEIDPYEFLGEEKVEGTGVAKRLEDKTEIEEGKKSFSQSFLNFIKDTPEAFASSTVEAGANLSNNIVQLFGFGSNRLFKGTEKGQFISDATTEFAQGYNKSTQELIAKLRDYSEKNDVNGVSELMTDIGIDIAATVPIQKILKKTGIPSYVSTPLSFGLAYGMTGGEKEKDVNVFIDSEAINALNEALGVLPDTPEAKVAELVNTTFEGTAWGAFGQQLVKVFKILKNNVPAYMNQQTATSVGGAAATGEAVNQISDTEKKTLNFDEQSQISSPMPDDNEMASAGLGPVFRSILKEAAKKIPNKGSGEQLFNTLKNTPGLKQQELKWSGLDDFLKGKKNVSKEEIQDYLKKNSLDVSEVQRPRRTTVAEGEKELLLESRLGDLDDELMNYMRDKPNALVTNDMDKYRFLARNIDTDNFANRETDTTYNTMKTLLDDIPEEEFLSKYKYNDKIVFNYLVRDGQPFTRTGPTNVIDTDKLLSQGYSRQSRYEFEPLEIKKFYVNKELKEFNKRFKDSGTKFGTPSYTEPGGKDYKELIFKLKGDRNYPIEYENLIKGKQKTEFPYKSPEVHFGTKNEFAHVRFKTREFKGQKVLTVEEMQSDLVQDMKKAYSGQVTDFPFKNNWYELVTKRLIRYAADNDFDAVAIPKGSTIASRYNQSTDRVIRVNVKPKLAEAGTDPSFEVTYFGGGNREIQRKTFYSEELKKFEKEIGSKNYSQLKDNIDNFVKNRPEDELINTNYFAEFDEPLMLGSGKGKLDLYDKAIPSYLKKYAKKWNAKVYDDNIEAITAFDEFKDIPVTIIQLTDDMKKSVQTDGQALFSLFGLGVGAEMVSDNIQNNIISQTTN